MEDKQWKIENEMTVFMDTTRSLTKMNDESALRCAANMLHHTVLGQITLGNKEVVNATLGFLGHLFKEIHDAVNEKKEG